MGLVTESKNWKLLSINVIGGDIRCYFDDRLFVIVNN